MTLTPICAYLAKMQAHPDTAGTAAGQCHRSNGDRAGNGAPRPRFPLFSRGYVTDSGCSMDTLSHVRTGDRQAVSSELIATIHRGPSEWTPSLTRRNGNNEIRQQAWRGRRRGPHARRTRSPFRSREVPPVVAVIRSQRPRARPAVGGKCGDSIRFRPRRPRRLRDRAPKRRAIAGTGPDQAPTRRRRRYRSPSSGVSRPTAGRRIRATTRVAAYAL